MIHPSAVIAPQAQIGADVEIAPFAVIGADVVLGDRCKIGPHVVLSGHTTIGEGTEIHTGANIGDTPQDVHYRGEITYTDIGKNCIIREYVTIHRGTGEGTRTTVGDNVLLMAMSHLGHNCQIGNGVVIANASLLAGHVTVADHAFLSGCVLVHQFVRIGRLAMVGGGNGVVQDIPPFCLLQNHEVQSSNIVGLRRAEFASEVRDAIHDAVKIYFCYGLTRQEAVARIQSEVPSFPEVQEFIDFVMTTKRGIMPGHRLK